MFPTSLQGQNIFYLSRDHRNSWSSSWFPLFHVYLLLLLFLFLFCLASFSYSSHKPKKQSCPRGCVGILLIFSLLPRYYEYFSACLLWKQRALPPSSKLPNLRQELSVVVQPNHHNDNLSVLSVERTFVSSHYPLDFVFFLFSLVCTTAIPSCVAATWELNVPLCS